MSTKHYRPNKHDYNLLVIVMAPWTFSVDGVQKKKKKKKKKTALFLFIETYHPGIQHNQPQKPLVHTWLSVVEVAQSGDQACSSIQLCSQGCVISAVWHNVVSLALIVVNMYLLIALTEYLCDNV